MTLKSNAIVFIVNDNIEFHPTNKTKDYVKNLSKEIGFAGLLTQQEDSGDIYSNITIYFDGKEIDNKTRLWDPYGYKLTLLRRAMEEYRHELITRPFKKPLYTEERKKKKSAKPKRKVIKKKKSCGCK